jgi:hypothetical protein
MLCPAASHGLGEIALTDAFELDRGIAADAREFNDVSGEVEQYLSLRG